MKYDKIPSVEQVTHVEKAGLRRLKKRRGDFLLYLLFVGVIAAVVVSAYLSFGGTVESVKQAMWEILT